MDKKQKKTEQTPENQITTDMVASAVQNDNNILMKRSRIRKSVEKKSKRLLVITSLGLLLLIVLLVIYGQTLLVNFSLVLSKSQNTSNDNTTADQSSVYVAPPIIDELPEATNSASIQISGTTSIGTKDEIKLYINNELVDVTHPKTNDIFVFDGVKLKEGENKIKTIAVIKDKKSGNSNTITISYLKSAPDLSIDEPQDGQSFSGEDKILTIKGKTNPEAQVSVNDFVAVMKNDGSFSYRLGLHDGDNQIKVITKDQAGNKTEKEIKVQYSP